MDKFKAVVFKSNGKNYDGTYETSNEGYDRYDLENWAQKIVPSLKKQNPGFEYYGVWVDPQTDKPIGDYPVFQTSW